LVTLPVPLITLAMVSASLRLKASVPLLVTLPEPSEPLVEPLPTWRVPAPIVVPPA